MYLGAINRKGMVSESGAECDSVEAIDYMNDGGDVALPNAGAGSYRKVFCDILGFIDCKVIEWSSSAGDWSFAVFDGATWYAAFQSNRYPRAGYCYSLNRDYQAETFEELCGLMEG